MVTKTTQKMDSVVWTGNQFLYVQNTANTVWPAPPAGRAGSRVRGDARTGRGDALHPLARHERVSRPGAIFCHSPDNKIYEISPDGSSVSVFATLPAPYPPASDGALTFDSVGRFGYQLVAATGRSGAAGTVGRPRVHD